MYKEQESPNEGRRYFEFVLNQSTHDGACLRNKTNRNRPMKGVFKAPDEPESPNEGRCLRYNYWFLLVF